MTTLTLTSEQWWFNTILLNLRTRVTFNIKFAVTCRSLNAALREISWKTILSFSLLKMNGPKKPFWSPKISTVFRILYFCGMGMFRLRYYGRTVKSSIMLFLTEEQGCDNFVVVYIPVNSFVIQDQNSSIETWWRLGCIIRIFTCRKLFPALIKSFHQIIVCQTGSSRF